MKSFYKASSSCEMLMAFLLLAKLTSTVFSRKLFKGENFHEFRGFVAIRESFLREIWGVVSFGAAKVSNPRSFLRENRIFTNS